MELGDIPKRMVLAILISLLAIIAGSIAYYRSLAFLPFAFGAVLGAGLNVLKIKLILRSVDKAVAMEKRGGGNYIRLQLVFRLVLTGLVLGLSVAAPQSIINLYGTAAGLLTWQIAAWAIRMFPGKEAAPHEGSSQ